MKTNNERRGDRKREKLIKSNPSENKWGPFQIINRAVKSQKSEFKATLLKYLCKFQSYSKVRSFRNLVI